MKRGYVPGCRPPWLGAPDPGTLTDTGGARWAPPARPMFQSARSEQTSGMMTSERDAATALARRIKSKLIDPSKIDEADQPPSDKPPAYAEALMSEAPASIERAADVERADWVLIASALEHYAACGNGTTGKRSS